MGSCQNHSQVLHTLARNSGVKQTASHATAKNRPRVGADWRFGNRDATWAFGDFAGLFWPGKAGYDIKARTQKFIAQTFARDPKQDKQVSILLFENPRKINRPERFFKLSKRAISSINIELYLISSGLSHPARRYGLDMPFAHKKMICFIQSRS